MYRDNHTYQSGGYSERNHPGSTYSGYENSYNHYANDTAGINSYPGHPQSTGNIPCGCNGTTSQDFGGFVPDWHNWQQNWQPGQFAQNWQPGQFAQNWQPGQFAPPNWQPGQFMASAPQQSPTHISHAAHTHPEHTQNNSTESN